MESRLKRKRKKWNPSIKDVILLVVLGAIAALFLLNTFVLSNRSASPEEITYKEFITLCKKGDVDTVYLSGSDSDYMTATLLNDDTRTMSVQKRKGYSYPVSDKRLVPCPQYDEFRKDLMEMGVAVVEKPDFIQKISSFLSTVFSILPTVIICMIILYAYRSPANGFDADAAGQDKTMLSDVIGLDEIVEDMQTLIKFLKSPESCNAIGSTPPKGILLTGEPGTGKTLIAKAVANEANVPFFSLSGSDFDEMFVGVGSRRVKKLFETARKNAPCVIFIDEIDSIGEKRHEKSLGANNTQTLNTLLKEMDGFTGNEGIIVLAATNRPECLDGALVRAGRFDRQIAVRPPRDWRVRSRLFEHYLKNYAVSDDVNAEALAKTTPGFTGADIAAVCNEAGIVAYAHGKSFIDHDCMEEALDKKFFHGSRSRTRLFDMDMKITAYHESGHAVVSYLLGHPISRASIISTTSGAGGAVFCQDSDSCLVSSAQMREQIEILYAGYISENMKFGYATNGASGDISKATELLIRYISAYGFDKEFGPLDARILSGNGMLDKGKVTARCSEVAQLIERQSYNRLKDHYYMVEALAQKLLASETLSGDEILEILDHLQQGDTPAEPS